MWVYDEEGCNESDKCPVNTIKFDTDLSDSFSFSSHADYETIEYKDGDVKGRLGSDILWLNEGSDGKAFYKLTFLLANRVNGHDNYSGILGLGPKSDLEYFKGIIQQMKSVADQGKSEIQPIFSLYYTDRSLRRSALTIGQPDIKKFAKSGLTAADVFYADLAI